MSSSGMLLRLTGSLREAWRLRSRPAGYGKRVGSGDVGPDLLFMRARALFRAGEKAVVIQLLEQALQLDPRFSDAIEAQGEVLDVSGDTAAAFAMYDRARDVRRGIRPGPPDRHFVMRQKGSMAAEILAYSSVVNSMKNNALPRLARGNAYLAGGQPRLALADYERVLSLRPGLLDALALKGEALAALGRYEEAVEIFDQVLVARPEDCDTLNARGIAHMAQGHVDEANADWLRQLALLDGRPAAGACVALRMADYEKATPLFEMALQRDRSDPYWTLYLGAVLLRQGRPVPANGPSGDKTWPAALLALQVGTAGKDDVLSRADTAGRRAEALFQLAMLECRHDLSAARSYWQQIVDQGPPDFIEYAAARNELSRQAP